MPAQTPEQVNEQLIDALNRGDIDAAWISMIRRRVS